METQKRLHIPLVVFQVTPPRPAAPKKGSSDSSGLQSHWKVQKGGKPTATIYRATSAKQGAPSWWKWTTHLNYPWGLGLCVGKGKENGELFSQGLMVISSLFLWTPWRQRTGSFLSLYPECLAYCKSSINECLLNWIICWISMWANKQN